MRYPRYMQYLGNKIQGNYDMCTSNERSKLRYRGIDAMYIGVKLLYNHDQTPQWTFTERSPTSGLNDGGERSVSKVQQNDLAFRMNNTSLKVLREVFLGLLIMKSNVKRGKSRRKRPRTRKKVLSQSRFVLFGCHSAIYPRERERERTRNTSQTEPQNGKKEVRMHEICINV